MEERTCCLKDNNGKEEVGRSLVLAALVSGATCSAVHPVSCSSCSCRQDGRNDWSEQEDANPCSKEGNICANAKWEGKLIKKRAMLLLLLLA